MTSGLPTPNAAQQDNIRYYRVADITLQIASDLPFNENTFLPVFRAFQVDGAGDDTVTLNHHFHLPELPADFGEKVYHRSPWIVYRNAGWVYLVIGPRPEDVQPRKVALFDADYRNGHIYSADEKAFKQGRVGALTTFSTDQVYVAQLLTRRQGCYLHAAGLSLDGRGFLFVGHSSAGKSTICTMLQKEARILCDDRVIVRKSQGAFTIYGTWSHGDVPEVSSASAPLRALFFLKKANHNTLAPVTDRKECLRLLLGCVIRPLMTEQWWDSTLALLQEICANVPCYVLNFDKSGAVSDLLADFDN